ncbi:MAG TPA: hypothetical protein V6D50_01510 [Chroococcales cyanobacterium]
MNSYAVHRWLGVCLGVEVRIPHLSHLALFQLGFNPHEATTVTDNRALVTAGRAIRHSTLSILPLTAQHQNPLQR